MSYDLLNTMLPSPVIRIEDDHNNYFQANNREDMRRSINQRRSTSNHNFQASLIPPSMPPTLPSLAYYSLNRNMNLNNLNIEPPPGRYHTLAHGISKPGKVNIQESSTSDYTSAKDWSENTTVTARSNSDYSECQVLVPDNHQKGCKYFHLKYLRHVFRHILFFFTLFSPVIMITLPKMEFMKLKHSQMKCGVGCEGFQVSFAFKIIILSVGSWAVFYRQKPASLPRLEISSVLIGVSLAMFVVSSWTVYILNYLQNLRSIQYESVVTFSSGILNTLLCFHYLTIILLKIVQPTYVLHILRSPDGDSRSIHISNVSIQKAASVALSNYYTESYTLEENIKDKKRAQLISATEESFDMLRRVPHKCSSQQLLDCNEAARSLFPHIIHPLQKYLKSTGVKQQQLHTMDGIIKHLTTTIMYGMSPRAFLEKYLASSPLIQNSSHPTKVVNWTLSSDTSLYKSIKEGVVFTLKHKEVTLLCKVISLPRMKIYQDNHFTKDGVFGYQGTRESPV